MSWDAYITNLKAPTADGQIPVMEAAICGMDGSIWAGTDKMRSITPDEIKKLIGNTTNFFQCGPTVGGLKCMMIKDQYDDPNSHCLQLKSRADAEGNTYNICVGRAHKSLVIVQGTKDANAGQLTSKVYSIVKYLREAGY